MIPRQMAIAVAVMLVAVFSMGIYVGRMRRRAGELAVDTRPVAPPPSGPTETVTLYVADDAAGALRARSATIPLPGGRQQRAEELLRALLAIYQQRDSPHPLAATADSKSNGAWSGGVAALVRLVQKPAGPLETANLYGAVKSAFKPAAPNLSEAESARILDPERTYSGEFGLKTVSYTHLTLPTICSV